MAIAIGAMAVLAVLTVALANVWTEAAWYDQVGYFGVWRTQWIARIVLFAGAAIVAGAAVWGSLRWAKSVRPALTAARNTPLDQYREQIRPIERVVTLVLPLLVGLIAGGAVASRWDQVLAFLNRSSFGYDDPQFGLDASFYVFTLPVLRLVVGFVLAIVIVCTILAAFVHLLYGGISGGGRMFVASKGARTQLGILGFIVMLAIAANYVLDRFSLVLNQGERFSGASYTDVNAILPARSILAGIAVLVAVMFLLVIWRGDWRIPATGVGLMALSAIVIGGVYPAIVQNFQVDPNAQEYEAPYIQRDIDATLYAYGLDDVDVTQYEAQTEADADALRADADTTAQIRLLDPNVVAPTFQQLQQNKQYYSFPETLTVDRYRVGDEIRDTVIAVRQLNLDGLSQENRSWVNDTTVFTHGFGVVAAYGNKVTTDGRPQFYQSGIPSVGELGTYEPRIYFGTSVPTYSIVGAPEGSDPWELDFPDDDAGGQVNNTYDGDGGPSIGNTFAKLMYALKFGEQQILFSDRVTEESQILYYRDPIERVARVAPYLDLDSTTYPAVVDGRVVWIVDGYTSTNDFPYAASISSTDVFAGTDPLNPAVLNYVRNSVKATVDAYDGTVTLYAWDPEDPLLKTWQKVFPSTLVPYSEMSADLMSHMRYPEDLFSIQRYQLTRYHVSDAAEFYSGQDFWANPADPTAETRLQPPYYLTLQMPGQDDPAFSLTSTFIPGGNSDRQVLTGFVAVNSETGDQPGVKHPDYGQFRLLELPRDATVSGPGQVQNQFRSDPEAQNVLNLLRQGETDVINGNLLTLPVGGGLLYVQPVYVRSSQGTQFPLLQKVFVSFGDEVGFADTLSGALDQVFGSGATDDIPDPTDPVDGQDPDEPAEPDEPTEPAEPVDPDASAARADLRTALADAQQALLDGQDALTEGDFAAYGEAQAALAEALGRAAQAEAALDAATEADAGVPADGESDASASPSPSASDETN
ncbi:UPF0182 family protein [Demequina sp. TTPB684]|uniref:UPF0182 family membrane protein n=1 Tax=unclassified Demequina TaxID=2620311 RepID=UPI001CF37608|nr:MULTISPECIES: UPF0182 family protein [unclassified Demequina]MCB2412103.1 UPF0182 family protein [Demequina sp. TTPB684]UPU89788.1 UPF0182 family protein [Demequina sp. TMPB413]